MDRRVFEPRPSGNDTRRRNALSMGIVVLAAGALWLYAMHAHLIPIQTPTSAGTSAPGR